MPANTTHDAFPQPPDASIHIWRYVDFGKYVALLKSGTLYFARADTLGDPFEGSLSKNEYDRMKEVAERGERAGQIPEKWRGRYLDVLMRNARVARLSCYMSCWHMNRGESEAMWKLYGTSAGALAIQSTYQCLADLLPPPPTSTDRGIYLGMVHYADHETALIPNSDIFRALMHKRESFQHEMECRAIIWRPTPPDVHAIASGDPWAQYPAGLAVSVDLERVVHRIVVSPTAPTWFSETVTDVTAKYGFRFPVTQSRLVSRRYL